ncbi:hypothetical protein RCO48_37470 [Peribacillus frigoritolerans]|nr:hypothetical protein [Peribacillus frigoritolerans]
MKKFATPPPNNWLAETLLLDACFDGFADSRRKGSRFLKSTAIFF